MLSRRTILSTIFGAATTPVLVAPKPGDAVRSTGEQNKYIMIEADANRISRRVLNILGDSLRREGFHPWIIRVRNSPQAIHVTDLSNLPPGGSGRGTAAV
jgi:hypothetical protein